MFGRKKNKKQPKEKFDWVNITIHVYNEDGVRINIERTGTKINKNYDIVPSNLTKWIDETHPYYSTHDLVLDVTRGMEDSQQFLIKKH